MVIRFARFFFFLSSDRNVLMTRPKIVSDSKSTYSESITIAHKENNIPPPTSFMSNITNKSSCFDWRQSRSEALIAKALFSLTYRCAINQTRSARYLAYSCLLLNVRIVFGVCSDCLFPQIHLRQISSPHTILYWNCWRHDSQRSEMTVWSLLIY